MDRFARCYLCNRCTCSDKHNYGDGAKSSLELRRSSFFELSKVDKLSKTLFTLGFLSLTIKLCLQLGSTVPAISKMAFGFRPIVIAYLHLVLLAFTTVFLIAYIYSKELITINKGTIIGIGIFVSGIYFK